MVLPTSSMVVANNGGVGFRNPATYDLEPINQPIPSDSAFGGAQATLVFWDDIDDKTGDVYYDQLADRMIIQWNDRILGGSGATVDFQIQIFEQIGPLGILAQYLFRAIEPSGVIDSASATIGYQDGGVGYGDYQWSFNGAGAVGDGTVLSLVVLSIAPAPPIPLLSSWGLIIATLLLLTAGSLIVIWRSAGQQTARGVLPSRRS